MSSSAPSQTRQTMVDDARMNLFHRRLAIYSSGGPFLDGYVLSIIGVAMVQLTPALALSTSQQGLLGASALIGIFFGAPLGGWATDRFGRQTLYTIDLLAIVGSSVAQFWADDFWVLFGLRAVDRHGRRRRLPNRDITTDRVHSAQEPRSTRGRAHDGLVRRGRRRIRRR